MTGDTVSAVITFGSRPATAPRIRFEGRVNPTDPKQVAGAFWEKWPAQVYAATLTATDRTKFLGRSERIVRKKTPVELEKAVGMRYGPNPHRRQAEKATDADEKKKLLSEAAGYDARRDREIAGLLRKVIADHPGTPAAVHSAELLLERAGRINAPAVEVTAWAKSVAGYAAGYVPRFEVYTALQTADALAGLDALAAVALPYAEKAVAESAAPSPRLQALKALALAQGKTGRTADAARTRTRAEESERELNKK